MLVKVKLKDYFMESFKVGTTQNDIKNLQIFLPPLEKQKRIVDYLDKIQEKTQALQKLQEETKKKVEKLREAILYKAFRGGRALMVYSLAKHKLQETLEKTSKTMQG